MSAFVATASTTGTATVAALGRLHNTGSSTATSSQRTHYTGRQRSSSFTLRGGHSNSLGRPTSLSSSGSGSPVIPSSVLAASKRLGVSTDALNKSLYQYDVAASSMASGYASGPPVSESTNSTAMASSRAQQFLGEGLTAGPDQSFRNTRQEQPPPTSSTDPNSDTNADQTHGNNTPTVCTGRSRSNTLTTTSTGAVDVASASISNQFDHIMRPRRPSLVTRLSGSISLTTTTIPNATAPESPPPAINHTAFLHPHHPADSHTHHYHEREEDESRNDNNNSSIMMATSSSSSTSSLPWANLQLGFAPRIAILIALFGLSLAGLYLLAQVLPPLSLPKSIDDVKIDASILQEFATETYEGWMRTFMVFSVVYMWKQCFGIPGSAFLNILAGALYGPWFGTFLTSLLTTLGSVLAYFMSFFLMEPIMNRYASSKLDQMRLQVQKKTMRSASKKKSLSTNTSSTATSTAIQTSINASSPSGASMPVHSHSNRISGNGSSSNNPSIQQGSLRPRSSSFTIRKSDAVADQGASPSAIYSSPYAAHNQQRYASASSTVLENPTINYLQHDEMDFHEGEALLSEDKSGDDSMLFMEQHDELHNNGINSNINTADDENDAWDAETDDEDQDEGTSLFMQLLLIRLFPLTPYWFINLASPLVGVPVVPFMTSMFLGCMPYNYICAQAGAILTEIHELRDIYQQPWILLQIVLVLVLSAAAVVVSKRTKKKQMEKDQRKHRTSEEDGTMSGDESTHRLLPQIREPESREIIAMATLEVQRPSSGAHKRDSAIVDMTGYRY
ncbi:Transmembrane protein 41A [Dissophora globulifera]|nr:Transmembrane protein 41A [Dissophora globulifera]